jgi:hypothetical protein
MYDYLIRLIAVCAALLRCFARLLTYASRAQAATPRPDYAVIARMELEVYGEAFEHEGAPARNDARDHAVQPRLAVPGSGLQDTDSFARRLARGPRYPDTTIPAARDQYLEWLAGYVKRGGKPTHFYDYPFRDFRYAASGTLIVESDYEFGANSREIIVARNVEARRTNPAGVFGGWAHTGLYFMHGYRTNKPGFVPVYSDPEFDVFRRDDERCTS